MCIYQVTNEQPPSCPLWTAPFPFVWYQTPADEVTHDSRVQRQAVCTALSSTLMNDVNESEHVDDKGYDDVLSDLLSRHSNDVNSGMFRDAGEVVTVQQIDDADMPSSWVKATNTSSTLKDSGVQKTFACSLCPKTFSSSGRLAIHKRIHTGWGTLTKHKCSLTVEQPNVCHISTKAFATSSGVVMQTNVGAKSHTCDVCYKQFTKRSDLERHLLTHTGERPHKCNVCHKQLRRRSHLKLHMLTHTGERPHQCDVCQTIFSQLSSLKIHMRIHTGERPHKCDMCQKSFTQYGTLKTHMLRHTGERPHKCDVCHKEFTQRGYLKQHMLIHTGERPYECDVCGKQFTERNHLKTHMLTHTGERRTNVTRVRRRLLLVAVLRYTCLGIVTVHS